MRRLIGTVVFSLTLAVATTTAHAQLQFFAGMLFGQAMTSSESPTPGGSNAIFTAHPDLLKKVDPMKIRYRSTASAYFCDAGAGRAYTGSSNEQLFKLSFGRDSKEDTTKYVVLQIVRVIDGAATAAFWFVYIEKDLIQK